MPKAMRAKIYVEKVEQFGNEGKVTQESVHLKCVSSSKYGPNGESEDNTFARYTPCGGAHLQITNPELLGHFRPGQTFYVEFTPVEQPAAVGG
jgi:hypothetical protein